MPVTINVPSGNYTVNSSLLQENYSYDYPEGLALKPGSELHERLAKEIKQRAYESWMAVSPRRKDWEDTDTRLRMFRRPERRDRYFADDGRAKRDGQTEERMIVMPTSFATLETLLTYMTTAFIQDPIFRYSGTGPEDVIGAMSMQAIVQQQAAHYHAGLNLHTQWRDAFAYGFGVVQCSWQQDFAMVYSDSVDMNDPLGPLDALLRRGEKRPRERRMTFEGNKLSNIDPYSYLPDPNVPVYEVNAGEYQSWVTRASYIKLLRREGQSDGAVFNVQYLKHVDGSSSFSHLTKRPEESMPVKSTTTSPVDVLWMYIDLVPNDWDLGPGKTPEKWLFALAADQVIIAASPVGLDHDLLPLAVCAPDYDGYTTFPIARMEIMGDVQEVIDFLYNSHIANIRKALNDMLIVDPHMVNIKDLEDPRPGKLIRTRRAAWGRGNVSDYVKQLQVTDVTSGNINEALFLEEMGNKAVGAGDAVQGVIRNRGPRISAQASGNARNAGLSRLEKLALIVKMQSMDSLAFLYAAQTRQLLQEDTYVKLSGDMLAVMAKEYPDRVEETPQGPRIKVGPRNLDAAYDLSMQSPIVPGSEDVQTWVDLFQIMLSTQDPRLIQSFDVPKVFKHIARQMGAKNIDDFFIQPTLQQETPPQVMPDEQVDQEVQAGNLIPMEG